MRLLLVAVSAVVSLVGAPAAAAAASWPLAPRPPVVSAFDPPDSPWGRGHRGVDLLGHPGERVHAAAAGRISYAGVLAGRGVVVVDHGAVRTTYEPVQALVRVGHSVAEGEVIGTLQLGMSHCFPRACLHWGLLRGDTYLDPLTLVGAGPVRLWPLAGAPARASPGGAWRAAPGRGAVGGVPAAAAGLAAFRLVGGPGGTPRAVVPW